MVARIRLGRGRQRPITGCMNKLEKAYGEHLEMRKLAGEILEWHYDAVKFRLAQKTFYSPDFLVMLADGDIEFHETKGFWEDDARCKIKVAADKFPFRFVGVQRKGSQWYYEEF